MRAVRVCWPGPRLCVLRAGQAPCLLPKLYPMQPRPGPLRGPRLKAYGACVHGGAMEFCSGGLCLPRTASRGGKVHLRSHGSS